MEVNPERDPGDDDDHGGRNVELDEVVAELTLQEQLHSQTSVRS